MPVGKKDDQGKHRLTLVPLDAFSEVLAVLEYGAARYGENNWRSVARRRYLDAAARHLFALVRGETHDEESGLHHAAHLATNALFLFCLPPDKPSA